MFSTELPCQKIGINKTAEQSAQKVGTFPLSYLHPLSLLLSPPVILSLSSLQARWPPSSFYTPFSLLFSLMGPPSVTGRPPPGGSQWHPHVARCILWAPVRHFLSLSLSPWIDLSAHFQQVEPDSIGGGWDSLDICNKPLTPLQRPPWEIQPGILY